MNVWQLIDKLSKYPKDTQCVYYNWDWWYLDIYWDFEEADIKLAFESDNINNVLIIS